MSRIIAVANQKGGVGKTTSCANIGGALAEVGQTVLFVDMDARGDLTSYFGVATAELAATVYEGLFEDSVAISEIVVGVGSGLELAPADIDLAGAALLLPDIGFAERQEIVREALAEVGESYDFVLLDLPPGLELLTVAALGAADEVIIPQQCSFLALHGLRQVNDSIERTQEANPNLRICGILLTMQDRRTVHHRQVIRMVREAFGDLVFDTMIPQTIRFQDAAIAHQTIIEYDPSSEAAEVYRAVAQEVLERG